MTKQFGDETPKTATIAVSIPAGLSYLEHREERMPARIFADSVVSQTRKENSEKTCLILELDSHYTFRVATKRI